MATRWLTQIIDPEGGVVFVEAFVYPNGESSMKMVEDGGPQGYQVRNMEFNEQQTKIAMKMLKNIGHVVCMGNVARLNPNAKEFVLGA
jgi:hypothetical protein